jgi:hypothetical protein
MANDKSSEQTRKDLEKAQALIRAKKFDDARAILITIDDPTADKWLARLNEMSLKQSPNMPNAGLDQAQVVYSEEPKKKKPGCVQNVASAAVLLFICAIVYGLFNPNGRSPEDASNTREARTTERSQNNTSNVVSNVSTDAPRATNTARPTNTPEPGTRGNPFPAGSVQEVRDGRLQVNSIRTDMSQAVHSMNMFNQAPETGQEWVIVDVTFNCDISSEDVCTTQFMQFELVGDMGQVYNHQMLAVIDNVFPGEIFGGGQATGSLGFIVDSDDSNFLLVLVDFGRKFFAIP